MLCSTCGGSVVNGALFCSKCGKTLAVSVGGGAAAAPARIQPQPKRRGVQSSYVVALLLAMALFAAYVIFELHHEQQLRAAQIVQAPQLRQHKATFGNGALTVPQNHVMSYKMEVPADATNVKLQGHFSATGGTGNDIVVSVMTEDAFINARNGHGEDDKLWNSDGKVTVGDISVALPNGAGAYYLVFDNRFSLLSPKAVAQDIALTYLSRN